jgi:hypothetical protein
MRQIGTTGNFRMARMQNLAAAESVTHHRFDS